MKGPAEDYIKLLVKMAEEKGLEPGGTLIQKGMFFLDNAFGAGLDIKFRPYLYGPYSAVLASLVDYLEWRGELAESKKQIPEDIRERVEHTVTIFEKALKEFPEYRTFKARLWELLGATYYVMRYVRPESSIEEVVSAVREWKDYFDEKTVKRAVKFLEDEVITQP